MVGDKELDTGFRCWSCKEFTTLRARIAELEQELAYFPSTVISLAETVTEREAEINQLRAELAAIKAQEPGAIEFRQFMTAVVTGAGLLSCGKQSKGLAAELSATAYKYLLGAPVSEAKAQEEGGRKVTRIELDDGKYTVVHDSGAGLHALRYGEHWRDMTGDGLVLAMAQEIEDLRRRIVPVQHVSVPDGWKLVPVEPTREMISAAGGAITTPDDLPPVGAGGWSMNDLAFRSRYRDAIAAAPAAPAADAGVNDHD